MRKVGLPDFDVGHPGGIQRNQLRVVRLDGRSGTCSRSDGRRRLDGTRWHGVASCCPSGRSTGASAITTNATTALAVVVVGLLLRLMLLLLRLVVRMVRRV